jgi:uncharacterized protein involved in outer membrane biogenesis
MRTFLKWAAIIAEALIAILVIGVIALPFVFPLEKIKEFAVAKISEAIHREVRVGKVSFDIFSGIKIKALYVGNRPGFAKKPFIAADSIELRYAFWPLFSRKVIIKEIRLVKPEILIEKNVRGEFNFSDLIAGSNKPKVESRAPSTGTKPPFDLLVSSFSIRNGRITYADHGAGTTNDVRDFNLSIGGFELALVKPIDLRASAVVTYQGKEIPLSLSGRIGVNLPKETINVGSLSLSIAGESVNASATVSNWQKAPNINLSLSSKKINVDPLLAVFAAAPAEVEKKPRPGELTKMVNSLAASIPRNLSANTGIDIANLTFQKFKVDKIEADLGLAGKAVKAKIKEIKIYDGVLSGSLMANLNVPGIAYEVKDLRLSGFNAAPFSNAVIETFLTKLPDYKDLLNKVYGNLDVSASLVGRGVEPQDILANLNINGSLTLKNGELKRLKTLAEVGKTLKSTTLQEDIKFGALYTAFNFSNQVVTAKALKIEETDFKLYFNGGADLKSLNWVPGNRLNLKLAPHLTRDLPKEFVIFKDDKGWLTLTFEITGSLKKPFPKPILEKPLEVATEKIKAKIEAKKVEIVEKAKADLATKEEEAKKALEEEAKKKLKDLIKF